MDQKNKDPYATELFDKIERAIYAFTLPYTGLPAGWKPAPGTRARRPRGPLPRYVFLGRRQIKEFELVCGAPWSRLRAGGFCKPGALGHRDVEIVRVISKDHLSVGS